MLQNNDTHEEEIHLRDYLQIVLRRKWIIFASFLTMVILVTFQSFKATPMYQASTQVKIDRENPNVLSFEEVLAIDTQDSQFYQTQYQILVSRSLALRVIKALNLNDSPEFQLGSKSNSFSIRSILGSLINRESKDPDKGIQKGEAELSGLISSYLGRLEITPIKGSSLVNISFIGFNPEEIKRIVNRHASEYIDSNLEVRFAASNDAVKWLQKQILEKKELVEKAENILQMYNQLHKRNQAIRTKPRRMVADNICVI